MSRSKSKVFPDDIRQRFSSAVITGSGDVGSSASSSPSVSTRGAKHDIQLSRIRGSDTEEEDEYQDIETLTFENQIRKTEPCPESITPGQLLTGLCASIGSDIKEECAYLFTSLTFQMTSYTEENVRRTALISRLTLLIIQLVSVLTLTPHVNDGFKTSGPESMGAFDRLVNATFGGFVNWDGQYFLHVATQGYTHQNTMAFFPLFPITTGILARLSHLLLFPVLSLHSLTLLAGIVFNVWCFQEAAVVLAKLVILHYGNSANYIVPTVVFLFCYNPASIFFTAFYSESLFALLTFSCILELNKRRFFTSIIYASLGAFCRSNGLLNFALIGVAALTEIVYGGDREPSQKKLAREPPFRRYVNIFKKTVVVGILCLIGLAPFIAFQGYCVNQFCRDVQGPLPDFCLYHTLPYSHIQKANWNVGFLQYFELKQIPNFILALPVLLTLAIGAQRHAKVERLELSGKLKSSQDDFYLNILSLALAWHGLFLTFFCLFFIHVQVSTRMIMSACPYIYFYIAERLNQERSIFLKRLISWMPVTAFVQIWFSTYFLVGTIMFALGYPWT